MPAGAAPAGSAVGELASSVRLPPLTVNAPTASALLSSTYRVRPSGLRRASAAPTPLVALTEVEVWQEVLLEVWRCAARFQPGRGSAMAWVTTIAHRRAVDRFRAQ